MIIRIIYISLLIPFLWNCKGTSRLAEDQYLYTGGELKIQSPVSISGKSQLITKMENYIRPEPNTTILGMRPKLWFYNLFDSLEKEKGIKHWVKHTLGNPPVLLRNVDEERVASTIQLGLENNGFFDAKVSYEIKKKKKTASVIYNAKVTRPYQFGQIHLPEGDNALAKAIRAQFNTKFLSPGKRFNLEDLQEERLRLETELKNKGFYYFNDSHLLYRIDSTVGDRKVEVYMTIKNETPPKAKRIQKIKKIYVNSDFELGDTLQHDYDTIMADGVTYVRQSEKFRPEVITNQIRLRENDIYTRNSEEITISRLIDLGVFRYVNIFFEDAGIGEVNSFIRLSPMKKKSIRTELRGVTKSNSFVGPFLTASFSNRNFLKGAELYQLTLTGGYEWQIGPQTADQPLNSYELGIRNSLRVPRFITPFDINYYSSKYVPTTNFELGYRLMKRINYFQLNSFDLGYGFTWRENVKKIHNLYPVDVNYIRLTKTSDEFEELLSKNRFLRRSYENQFILGSTYGFTYNSQAEPDNRNNTHNFYFNGNIDISGNLMHVVQKTSNSEESTEDEPYTIFGSPYSQFVRTDFDVRHYLRLDRKNKIASRFIFGIGKPWGNSDVMPYTKQFSIGGSSSIRAFRARSVGPGGFKGDTTSIFVDQTADIKIETNVEYRFDLVGSFKGAVFVDAGNIWTIMEDENRPDSRFQTSNFLRQLAIGAGVGVRLDIQFFVLRLDLASPVRVPSKDAGKRWILGLKDVNRQGEEVSNLVLNIAIGYPF